ncbi:hypothetical protein [Pseudomonas cyclaminis]|uniref:hypothetical protein n=1 Tax=Pseudomonas cyclaminis TaxID=2781239 RepID=UPI0038101FCC
MHKGLVPVGGYFELELPRRFALPYSGPFSYYYQSARAAFRALISAAKPTRVWLPTYICESMISSVVDNGSALAFYDQSDFLAIGAFNPSVNDIIVIVNYFGLHDHEVNQLLSRLNRSQVVVDNSQAFFSKPFDCLGTLYSPRKFFGVPDGGILHTRLKMSPEVLTSQSDIDSLNRSLYLTKRLGLGAEAGYADYQAAESTLECTKPQSMSNFTRKILSSVDMETIATLRRRNYSFLSDNIAVFNKKHIALSSDAVPLCYPFTTDNKAIRGELIKRKIFLATYWPDVRSRVSIDSVEMSFVENTLPIPIDQRNSLDTLEWVVSVLNKFF